MALINRTSITFKILSASVLLILSGIIIHVFVDNWHKIPFDELSFDYRFLLVSFALYIFLSALGNWLWKYILNLFKVEASFMSLWRIFIYSQTARYIPGKVWQYLSKLYWGTKIGLTKKINLLSTLLETIFLMSGAFIVSLFSLPLFLKNVFFSYNYFYLLVFFVVILLVLIHPRVLEKIINTFGKKFIANKVSFQFSYFRILLLVMFYSLTWILIGIQAYLFTLSFYKIPVTYLLHIASLHAGSWLIGFVSIITPSGLGVREGIFVLGFKTIVPVSFAILIAILIRLHQVALDAILAVVFLIFDKGAWQNFLNFKKTSSTSDEM